MSRLVHGINTSRTLPARQHSAEDERLHRDACHSGEARLTLVPEVPHVSTEGVKYAGSKLRLIPHILAMCERVLAGQAFPASILDGFSGTTRVSQALARCGHRVTCSDISVWSEILGLCYLNGRQTSDYVGLVRHLNGCEPVDGWFTETYGANRACENGRKSPWQRHNTARLDAIREEIDKLNLDPVDRAVALTALLLALDRVDSTLGHFSSYLKDWSPRSYGTLELKVPDIVGAARSLRETGLRHEILRGDIFDTVEGREFDLAYLDPPYGSNNEKMPPSRVRYAAYYHLWTTVCLNDRPEVFGAARRREDSRDRISGSVFEEFRRNEDGEYIAVKAIGRLLDRVNARHIVLSYSSGGRATAAELRTAIDRVGQLVEVRQIDYRRNVMASMKWTDEWVRSAERKNTEYLFLIDKG